jgi:hypothetical protein
MPIEQQIHALEQAGHILVHGDQPGHHGEGYSLHRTILSHGTKLDPRSEHYFELDIYKMSSVPEVEKRKRLAHILRKFPLDQTQRQVDIGNLTTRTKHPTTGWSRVITIDMAPLKKQLKKVTGKKPNRIVKPEPPQPRTRGIPDEYCDALIAASVEPPSPTDCRFK